MNRLIRPIVVMVLLLTISSGLDVAQATPSAPTTAITNGATTANIEPALADLVPALEKYLLPPGELYRRVHQAVYDNFLWQGRLKEWQAWGHKFDGKLHTHKDAEDAIKQMLDSLGDPYTYIVHKQPPQQVDNKIDAINLLLAQGSTSGEVATVQGHKIGYVKITGFRENTDDEVQAVMSGQTGADAYILDLRGNPGGYIYQSWNVFGMYVDKGLFGSMKGCEQGESLLLIMLVTDKDMSQIRNGASARYPRQPNLTGGKPMIVLVDNETASAAEMLAGALKANHRAELLGTTTYGKGICQNTFPLDDDCNLQITFAYGFQPNHFCIHEIGLKPDYFVLNPKGGPDRQLEEAKKLLIKKLDQ